MRMPILLFDQMLSNMNNFHCGASHEPGLEMTLSTSLFAPVSSIFIVWRTLSQVLLPSFQDQRRHFPEVV